jgi:hypothetical protein
MVSNMVASLSMVGHGASMLHACKQHNGAWP